MGEVDAIRGAFEALEPLPMDARRRALVWLYAHQCELDALVRLSCVGRAVRREAWRAVGSGYEQTFGAVQ